MVPRVSFLTPSPSGVPRTRPRGVTEAAMSEKVAEAEMSEKAADLQSPLPPTSTERLLTNLGLITAWYSSNIAVLLLNKYLLSSYGFMYPIFLTMCHMVACSVLSFVAIPWLKLVPVQSIRSRVQFLKISALSLVFCGSVVSGNVSLRYLPVSFNQAVGATTPFFTAVFACIMTPRRESWITYATLVPVVAGVIVASGAEPSFHLIGFIVCIGATAARAFKTVNFDVLRGGNIELHESSSVHGSNSSNSNTSCNNDNGEECDQRNAGTG